MERFTLFATGDLHLGQSLHYGGNSPNGLPSKLIEQKQLLMNFVDTAIEKKADIVTFGGDYFPKHARINPDAMKILAQQVIRLANAGIEVRMLVGNHDKARQESMDHTVNVFELFDLPKVLVINKPTVEVFKGAILMYLPHLIPSELFSYQKNERETLAEVFDHVVDTICEEAERLRVTAALPTNTPRILFGHFGITEAGKGSESDMLAGNNICIPVAILDRPAINLCVMSHVHKFWKYKGDHTNVAFIGSMDRFDFGEAGDRKVYGQIDVDMASTPVIKMGVTETGARKFVHVREPITNALDLTFMGKYDIKDAVVRVTMDADKDFTSRKELLEAIRAWFEREKPHHTMGINVIQKPTFTSRNEQVLETKTVEENVRQLLQDEGFELAAEIMEAHKLLFAEYENSKQVKAES